MGDYHSWSSRSSVPPVQPTFEEAEARARLMGRHGRSPDYFSSVLSEIVGFTDGQLNAIRVAYAGGRLARTEGVPCMCIDCMTPASIEQKQRRRFEYEERRFKELRGSGLGNAEIERRIADEIDRGMAL